MLFRGRIRKQAERAVAGGGIASSARAHMTNGSEIFEPVTVHENQAMSAQEERPLEAGDAAL